jgi:hypothetical protein
LLLLTDFPSINQIYKYHDYLVGHTIFTVLAILSTLQIGYLQTWLLYHNALSAGVAIEDILKHARKTRERGIVEDEDISTLRAQLQEQERLVKQLYETLGKSGGASVGLNGGIGGSIGLPSSSSSSSSSSTAGVYNSINSVVTETTGLLSSANNSTYNNHHHPQVSFAIPSQKSPALPPTASKPSVVVSALSSSLSKGYGSTATDSTFIHVPTSVPFSTGNTPASVPVSVPVSTTTTSEMKKVSDLFLIRFSCIYIYNALLVYYRNYNSLFSLLINRVLLLE